MGDAFAWSFTGSYVVFMGILLVVNGNNYLNSFEIVCKKFVLKVCDAGVKAIDWISSKPAGHIFSMIFILVWFSIPVLIIMYPTEYLEHHGHMAVSGVYCGIITSWLHYFMTKWGYH